MADNKMMDKLMSKKKDSKMNPEYKGAKMSALQELKKAMAEMMSDDVKGLKKVTVASDSKQGLEEGLEKAKEAFSKMPSEDEESAEHEAMESSEEEGAEHEEDMSAEEIDARIKELEALKAKKLK